MKSSNAQKQLINIKILIKLIILFVILLIILILFLIKYANFEFIKLIFLLNYEIKILNK